MIDFDLQTETHALKFNLHDSGDAAGAMFAYPDIKLSICKFLSEEEQAIMESKGLPVCHWDDLPAAGLFRVVCIASTPEEAIDEVVKVLTTEHKEHKGYYDAEFGWRVIAFERQAPPVGYYDPDWGVGIKHYMPDAKEKQDMLTLLTLATPDSLAVVNIKEKRQKAIEGIDELMGLY